MTMNFYSFVQGPGYFRFKNSFLKDSYFTAKLNNAISEILIFNSIDSNLDLDCNLNVLKYLTRKDGVSQEHLLQRLEEEIKELAEDHARLSHSHLVHQKQLNEEAIRITQDVIDSMISIIGCNA